MSEIGKVKLIYDKYYVDNTADVASVIYNKYSTERVNGFHASGDIFFDNIVVWCIEFVDDIGRCHTHIRQILQRIGLRVFNVSLLNLGISICDDIVPIGSRYASFKVSLSRESPEDVVNSLATGVSAFKSSNIFLRDIDITADCLGSATREEIEKFILQNRLVDRNDIIKDKDKVGNNCISWYANLDSGERIRIKIYNKFVQMLESSEVRAYIGSRLASVVADPSDKFMITLDDCKNFGLTRVEVKVYSSEIHGLDSYITLMNGVLDTMQGCPIYKTSFENQWKALVDEVYDKHVLMIYMKDNEIFSYCHWYNSLTRRRQGIVKKNVKQEDVPNLISNYSFNDRITKYIEIDGKDMTEQFLMRNRDDITLIPGPNNSLYPSKRDISNLSRTFDSMGIVDYKGMKIGWPTRIERSSRPLSTMVVVQDDVSTNEVMGCVLNPNKTNYKVSHNCLIGNATYKVIAIGRDTFRNVPSIFMRVLTPEGEEILTRCSKSLFDVIDPIVNTSTGPFHIRTTSKLRTNSNHINDIGGTIVDEF